MTNDTGTAMFKMLVVVTLGLLALSVLMTMTTGGL